MQKKICQAVQEILCKQNWLYPHVKGYNSDRKGPTT